MSQSALPFKSTAERDYPVPTRLPAQKPRSHLRAVETELSSLPPPERQEAAVTAPGLPPLTFRLIGTIAIFAFEAVEGTRHVGQLGRWITAEVAEHLAEYRALILERRSLYQDTRRIVPIIRRVRADQPGFRTAEASVVLDAAGRSRAVALRFEGTRGRWQATSITVL